MNILGFRILVDGSMAFNNTVFLQCLFAFSDACSVSFEKSAQQMLFRMQNPKNKTENASSVSVFE